jgi:hypothetical protein
MQQGELAAGRAAVARSKQSIADAKAQVSASEDALTQSRQLLFGDQADQASPLLIAIATARLHRKLL